MKGTDKPIERAKSLRRTAPRTEKPAETKIMLEKTLPARVAAVDAFDEKIPIIGASTTFLLFAHTNNPMVARPAKIPVTEANIVITEAIPTTFNKAKTPIPAAIPKPPHNKLFFAPMKLALSEYCIKPKATIATIPPIITAGKNDANVPANANFAITLAAKAATVPKVRPVFT